MADTSSCIFCRIVNQQIPALRVYESEGAVAFLDIGPLADGHLLVIPREHYERLDEMPAEAVVAVTRCLPMLARAVMAATGANAYNLLQNNGKASGQEVAHVHFHIIPRRSGDGLGYRWQVGVYPPGRGEEIRQRLLTALGRSSA